VGAGFARGKLRPMRTPIEFFRARPN